MDLSILGCVKLKVLKIFSRFVGTQGELRKHPVTDGRWGFFGVEVGKEGNGDFFFLPFLSVCVSLSSVGSFGIVG